MEQLRNKKGQFARAETIFELPREVADKVEHQTAMSVRMKDRRREWARVMEQPETASTPETLITLEKTPPYNLTIVHGDDRIETIRGELADIQIALRPLLQPEPEVISIPEVEEPRSPLGILEDKEIKRIQKEQKEKEPKNPTEMLVVFNDTQLLKEADQEAIGAFLKYVEANKDRITHLIANGDIADFTAQSAFEKSLDQMNSTNDEVEATRWLFDYLSKLLPNAEKVFIEGNHEARWSNLIDAETGNEAWIKTMDEQFGLTEGGWQQIGYGSGQYYEWHNRIFWHGHRSGAKSNVPKLEMEDAGVSVTTAHINRNMFHETTDARGERKSGIVHGGFSRDNLGFMKKANTGWSQGFGVYFYDEKTKTETPYLVTMTHRNPRFVGPDGVLYDGAGWSIPGFEPVEKRKK